MATANKPLGKKQVQQAVLDALLAAINPSTAPLTPGNITDAISTTPSQVYIPVRAPDGSIVPVLTSASTPLQYSNGQLLLSQQFTQTPSYDTGSVPPVADSGSPNIISQNLPLIIAAGIGLGALALMRK